MRIRIVEVRPPKNVKQTYNQYGEPNPIKTKTYYKLQTSYLGWIWSDETEPESGRLYPTFDTLEEAEKFVVKTWFEQEIVIKEYKTQ